jgi:hypothetical protein
MHFGRLLYRYDVSVLVQNFELLHAASDILKKLSNDQEGAANE